MKDQLDILLVDDNIKEQNNFSLALNELHINYLCRFAKNYNVASELIRAVLPDYIFIYLPEKNEPDCFEEIKRMKAIGNITVIMFAHKIDGSLNKKLKQCGVKECLKKTSRVSELISILKRIL